MQIDLQGFGYYRIDKENYQKFVNILKLDTDFFLELVDLSQMVIPTLCLNFQNIDVEGPQPMGHIPTDIGKKRINDLKNSKIIIETNLKNKN